MHTINLLQKNIHFLNLTHTKLYTQNIRFLIIQHNNYSKISIKTMIYKNSKKLYFFKLQKIAQQYYIIQQNIRIYFMISVKYKSVSTCRHQTSQLNKKIKLYKTKKHVTFAQQQNNIDQTIRTADTTIDKINTKNKTKQKIVFYQNFNNSLSMPIQNILPNYLNQKQQLQKNIKNNIPQPQPSCLTADIFIPLFTLYAKQQILKHYCNKKNWKFQSQQNIMQNIIFPTLDLLSIRKQHVKYLFQPYLKQLSKKYLLYGQYDTYSRMETSALLYQLAQIWIKIKQGQIALKRHIRNNLFIFKYQFCNQKQHKTLINWKKLYKFLYEDKSSIFRQDNQLANVIKIFIFINKVHGTQDIKFQEEVQRCTSLEEWLDSY